MTHPQTSLVRPTNLGQRPPRHPGSPVCDGRFTGRRAGRPRARRLHERAWSATTRARFARLIGGPLPVTLVALQGLLTIALAGAAGRGYTHRLLLTAVLTENVGALLLRRHHPLLSLTVISLAYAIVDYPPTTLPTLLLAILTVRIQEDSRMGRVAAGIAAVVLIATPAIHGDLTGIG
jgi:hypothetical protein